MKPLDPKLAELDNPDLVSTYDELPLWSAPFGKILLDKIRMKKGMTVLDIGSGAGFPLIELAQRLGDSCTLYGLDRIRLKLKQYDLHNVTLINDSAEHFPFNDAFFDLIVSNNGINNVVDPALVLNKCFQASKAGAQLVMTMNLEGTMKEFYNALENVLHDRGLESSVVAVKAHIRKKRPPLMDVVGLLERAGYCIDETYEDFFSLRFLDGATMFDHYLIRFDFRSPWEKLLDASDRQSVLDETEQQLNALAARQGELRLTIPYACIVAEKQQPLSQTESFISSGYPR